MKKLLAENMLRFGVKNLNESSINAVKLLFEGVEELVDLTMSDIMPTAEMKEQVANGTYKTEYDIVLAYFKQNGVLFSTSQENAAIVYVNNQSFEFKRNLLRGFQTIKVNPGPEDPSKILTVGNINSMFFENPQDQSAESDYIAAAKYLNSLTIAEVNMQNNNSAAQSVLAKIAKNGAFDIAKTSYRSSNFYFYGITTTTPAASKEVVTTTTWTVPNEGGFITLPLPGATFKTGDVTIIDRTKLDAAVAELQTISKDPKRKISNITIQSSASGDQKVGGKSGYPEGQEGRYPLGTPYRPKSESESGNARLAFGRAKSVQAALGNIAPVKIDAMIQDGQDKARYANIIVKVDDVVDPAKVLSKSDLETILTRKKNVEDLGATRQYRVHIASKN